MNNGGWSVTCDAAPVGGDSASQEMAAPEDVASAPTSRGSASGQPAGSQMPPGMAILLALIALSLVAAVAVRGFATDDAASVASELRGEYEDVPVAADPVESLCDPAVSEEIVAPLTT